MYYLVSGYRMLLALCKCLEYFLLQDYQNAKASYHVKLQLRKICHMMMMMYLQDHYK
jgi:hypothetical protein